MVELKWNIKRIMSAWILKVYRRFRPDPLEWLRIGKIDVFIFRPGSRPTPARRQARAGISPKLTLRNPGIKPQ